MAQLGRALRSGRRGRVFESRRADENKDCPLGGPYFNLCYFIGHMTSNGQNSLRSGAEGSRGPGDLGSEPTGAKRRPRVRITSRRLK